MSNAWVTLSGVTERGEPFTAKRLAVLPDTQTRENFRFMMSIGWAYAVEGSNRLPNDQELERIAACEHALMIAAPNFDAILVGALSSDGFHQFVLYARDLKLAQIRATAVLPKPLTRKETAEIWNTSGTLDESWNFAEQIPIS